MAFERKMAIKGQDLSFFIGLATIVEVAIDRQSLLFYYLANGLCFEPNPDKPVAAQQ
jgi:hypothetical protein